MNGWPVRVVLLEAMTQDTRTHSLESCQSSGDWSRRGILDLAKMQEVLKKHSKEASNDPDVLLCEEWDAIKL